MEEFVCNKCTPRRKMLSYSRFVYNSIIIVANNEHQYYDVFRNLKKICLSYFALMVFDVHGWVNVCNDKIHISFA